MEHTTCCVCYEEENKVCGISCDRCNDGLVCIECIDKIDANTPDFISYCPVCRSILISYSLHSIVFYEFDHFRYKKPSENSSLIQRWVDNGTKEKWKINN